MSRILTKFAILFIAILHLSQINCALVPTERSRCNFDENQATLALNDEFPAYLLWKNNEYHLCYESILDSCKRYQWQNEGFELSDIYDGSCDLSLNIESSEINLKANTNSLENLQIKLECDVPSYWEDPEQAILLERVTTLCSEVK